MSKRQYKEDPETLKGDILLIKEHGLKIGKLF
jgi:hypothetical protein